MKRIIMTVLLFAMFQAAVFGQSGRRLWNGDAYVNGNFYAPTMETEVMSATQAAVHYIDFATDEALDENIFGRLRWNYADSTIEIGVSDEVSVQLGQEQLIRVVNDTGSTITNGSAVFISGSSGSRVTIDLAIATDVANASRVVGLTTEDIADSAEGFVTVGGLIRNVSTSAFTQGSTVYLSETVAGGLQEARSTPPNITYDVGLIVNSHSTEGEILVIGRYYPLLDQMSGVSFADKADGDTIYWNATDEVWDVTPQSGGGSLASLDDIANVSTDNKSTNDLLQWDGTYWSSNAVSSIIALLDSIGNVDTTGKSDGDILYWNASSSIWGATPQASGGGGSVASLDDIGDVSSVYKDTSDLLQWGGTYWESTSIASIMTTLDLIADVDTTGKNNADVLTWNATDGEWQAAAGGGGSGGARGFTITIASAGAMNAAEYDYQCDGTDDQLEINTALASLDSATGGTVILSEGEFYTSATIDMATSFITLAGQGHESTRIIKSWNSTSGQEGTIEVINYLGSDVVGCVLRDFGINGNKTVNTDTDNVGLLVTDFDRCLFTRLKITSFAGEGVYLSDASTLQDTDSVFSDSYISACLEGFDIGSGVEELIVAHVVSDGNTQEGFLSSAGERVSFLSCIAKSNGTVGFYVGGAENSLNGCLSLDNSQLGYELAAAESSINGCIAFRNGTHGIEVTGDYNKISGSVIYLNSGTGVYCSTGALGNLTVGNFIYDNVLNGVRYYNTANKGAIIGNSIQSNNTDGIAVTSVEDIFIANNFLSLNGSNAIYIGTLASEVYVVGNDIDDPVDHAIFIDYSVDVWIKDNVFRANDSGEANQAVSVDDGVTDSDRMFLYGNTFIGSWPGDYVLETGQTIPPIRLMTLTTDAGAVGEVLIVSSSSTAKVGFATDDADTITNVITVSSGASTNPIAVSWDVYSDPRFKTNIQPVTETEKLDIEASLDGLNFIRFDWKYPEPEPDNSGYSGDAVKFASDMEAYRSRKAAFESSAIKNNQLSIDIEDQAFPNTLATFDDDGNKIGINMSQLIMRLMVTTQQLEKKITELQKEIETIQKSN